jgi:hypothetical protein
MKLRTAFVASTVVFVVSIAMAAETSAQIVVPALPSNLAVPSGHTPFVAGHAYGTQNYVCQLQPGGFAWTFVGPQATLFDAAGGQLITHFLSPNPLEAGTLRATWQHSADTSIVWAAALASSADPAYVAPGAIPWLLLRIVGSQYGPTLGNTLTATTYIHRVNTSGGGAPSGGCSTAGDVGRKAWVGYTADYIFYRP